MAFRRTTPEAGAGEPAAAAGVIVPESDSLTAPPAPLIPTPPRGLTAAEVQERVATGRSNASDERDTRSLGQIVRANVITPFNGLLTTLFILIMITGRWQNALFGFVVIFNSLIGIIQEIRSRAVLDKLAVINAPQARVVRDGSANEIGVAGVVNDDLIQVRAGDQIVADGVLLATAGLEVDESLLTGESDPVAKTRDDEVRSGAFVVAGSGLYQATGVGPEAYAARLAAEARRYSLTKSELRAATNQLLRWISLIMAVTAPFIFWRQLTSPDNHGWRDALTGSVAALVGMVPDGLVLLTSMAFMLGVITLARRHTLVQELPAVEGLARVDVVCLDKTGTLTYGDISLSHVEVLGPEISHPRTSEFPALEGATPGRRRLWGSGRGTTGAIPAVPPSVAPASMVLPAGAVVS
ncbi:MAG: HAD-IC family P-type ATPase, partial [Promicromonosporaceae bacterium]|nr:HAD-IC family P-type ATPase [Promicromonosporaceae bacterium]